MNLWKLGLAAAAICSAGTMSVAQPRQATQPAVHVGAMSKPGTLNSAARDRNRLAVRYGIAAAQTDRCSDEQVEQRRLHCQEMRLCRNLSYPQDVYCITQCAIEAGEGCGG